MNFLILVCEFVKIHNQTDLFRKIFVDIHDIECYNHHVF